LAPVGPAAVTTTSAAADLVAPGEAFVAMSKISSIPLGGETPPIPSLPNAPMTSDPAAAFADGAVIEAVFAAKRPLEPSSGAAASTPPKARIAPAA
jgi:hypothetical protein